MQFGEGSLEDSVLDLRKCEKRLGTGRPVWSVVVSRPFRRRHLCACSTCFVGHSNRGRSYPDCTRHRSLSERENDALRPRSGPRSYCRSRRICLSRMDRVERNEAYEGADQNVAQITDSTTINLSVLVLEKQLLLFSKPYHFF